MNKGDIRWWSWKEGRQKGEKSIKKRGELLVEKLNTSQF